MILDDKNFDVDNNLETESAEFTIAANSKMFDILSNKIYEDPIRAIIRELTCNAIDANIDAGTDDPIKVYFPTFANPSLIVEDCGIGMTNEDVMTVYKAYGKSTKSNRNNVIGALGIGGKTPLAYTQQFTLVTARDGQKNSYIIYKDENGIPNVNRVDSEKSSDTGTTIEMIVKTEDIDRFYIAGIKTFLFYDKMPVIARGEDQFYDLVRSRYASGRQDASYKAEFEQARFLLKKDYQFEVMPGVPENIIDRVLRDYDATHGVIMGQIFYAVNPKQILDENYPSDLQEVVLNFPKKNYLSGPNKIFHVDLGKVSFQPSREALNYNKDTIKFLKKLFNSTFNDWVDTLEKNFATPAAFLKNWDKVPYANKIINFADKTAGRCKVINDMYNGILQEVFSPVWKAGSFIYYMRRNNHSVFHLSSVIPKECGTKPLISSGNIKDAFNRIFIDKSMKTMLVLDDEKQREKVIGLQAKANEKNKDNFTCPIAIRNRAMIKDINVAYVVTAAEAKKINKFANLTVVKFSDIIIQKEAKEPRERTKANTAGKVYDWQDRKYVDIADMLKVAKKDNVTYELFEGEVDRRGWWFKPDFKKLISGEKATKPNSIVITNHGAWRGIHSDVYSDLMDISKNIGVDLKAPAKHYLVDWITFKKNDLYTTKNCHYINDYALAELKRALPAIKNRNASPVIRWSNSVVDLEEAKRFLKVGEQKHPGFGDTVFGLEMKRIIAERATPETKLTTNVAQYRSIKAKLAGEVLAPIASDLDSYKKLWEELNKEFNDVIDAESKMTNGNSSVARVDQVTPMRTKYPMFNVIMSLRVSEEIVDYIALVEGLK
jgi:hypothetical protein